MLAVQNPVPSVDASNNETANGFIRDATLVKIAFQLRNTDVVQPSYHINTRTKVQ
jgi:hypothetical protein